jgi:hypothetical protein
MLSQARHFLRFVRGEAAPCAAAEALRDLQIAREYLQLL